MTKTLLGAAGVLLIEGLGIALVVILLGFHLRHGIWSAFQSLGAMKPRLTSVIYTIGVVLAVLIAIGFLFVPLYIYFSA